MDNVIVFAPRRRPPEPEPPVGLNLRASLEEAAQTALDTADRIIAALDHLDGQPVIQDAEAASALGAQVPSFRDRDRASRAASAPAPAVIPPPPQVAAPEPMPVLTAAPEERAPFPPLPWAGSGNVIAAAGVALLDLMSGLSVGCDSGKHDGASAS